MDEKQAADQGYLSRDQAVGVGSMDDADSLLVGIVRHAYTALAGYASSTLDAGARRDFLENRSRSAST